MAKNGAVRNRFENQSRTIKRRERSKTGVKNTEKEEEEKEWKVGREEPRFVEVEEEEELSEEGGKKGVEGRPVESPGGRKKG